MPQQPRRKCPRCASSRRLQPGDDGIGCDRLLAPAPLMSAMPGAAILYHSRRAPGFAAEEDAEPADRLRPAAPSSSRLRPGDARAASLVGLAHARDVGAPGGGNARE